MANRNAFFFLGLTDQVQVKKKKRRAMKKKQQEGTG
jgi:hypothetical protein